MPLRIVRLALASFAATSRLPLDLPAQERNDPRVSPADLTLGELRTGAVVEASFAVRWADPQDGGKDAVVEADQ